MSGRQSPPPQVAPLAQVRKSRRRPGLYRASFGPTILAWGSMERMRSTTAFQSPKNFSLSASQSWYQIQSGSLNGTQTNLSLSAGRSRTTLRTMVSTLAR